MRAGTLDRSIVIQGKTVTQSDSGEVLESWVSFPARPASLTPLSGDERFSNPELVSKEQVEFRVRWSSAVASINAQNRII